MKGHTPMVYENKTMHIYGPPQLKGCLSSNDNVCMRLAKKSLMKHIITIMIIEKKNARHR